MKGELTGLFLCSSLHAMIGALILEVPFGRGKGREGRRGRRGERGRGIGKVQQSRGREGESGQSGMGRGVGFYDQCNFIRGIYFHEVCYIGHRNSFAN